MHRTLLPQQGTSQCETLDNFDKTRHFRSSNEQQRFKTYLVNAERTDFDLLTREVLKCVPRDGDDVVRFESDED